MKKSKKAKKKIIQKDGICLILEFDPEYIQAIIDNFKLHTQNDLEIFLCGRHCLTAEQLLKGKEIYCWKIQRLGRKERKNG